MKWEFMGLKIKRTVKFVIVICCLLAGLSNCNQTQRKRHFDINKITSYLEIPGITETEIAAIREIAEKRQSLSVGYQPSTEAFRQADGTLDGFVQLYCDLMSGIFDIPFTPAARTWGQILEGLNTGALDFTIEMTPTEERRKTYLMSAPIAQRSLACMVYGDSLKIKTELDINGRRIGFWKGTVTARSITDVYPDLFFEVVDVADGVDEVELLRSGAIDAFIADGPTAFAYIDYENIFVKNLFPLVFTPVSLVTANFGFSSIVSVMDRYIAAGGINKLYDLYREGNNRYIKFKFEKSLTREEKDYLENLAANGKRVPIALENDNYPISFYNERSREFQGIVPDILKQVGIMTEIDFNVVNDKNTTWFEMLNMLRTAKISMVSELLRSEEREGQFLWPDNPYASTRFAFISKTDYPYIQLYQVTHAAVGVNEGSAYESVYNSWFPGSNNLVIYRNYNDAFDDLEKGKLDLLFASENFLLSQLNVV